LKVNKRRLRKYEQRERVIRRIEGKEVSK